MEREYVFKVGEPVEGLRSFERMEEVVRCKECNKRNGDYCHRYHDGYSAFIHQDDFCSYGERREDAKVHN